MKTFQYFRSIGCVHMMALCCVVIFSFLSFSLFVWRCVHAPHWVNTMSSLPNASKSPRAQMTSERNHGVILPFSGCMDLLLHPPELNHSSTTVGYRCHMTQHKRSDVYVFTPHLKKKLQVAEHHCVVGFIVLKVFFQIKKRTCSKLSTISLKLPVEFFLLF